MTKLKWWGAPLEVSPIARLQRMDQYFPGEDSTILEAEPLTVRLRGVMIREDMDWLFRGDNDLIISTTFQCGSEPPVQRLHFMENNVSLGWQGAFFHEIVLSEQDFHDKILTLRIQVYDMDGVPSGLTHGVRSTASSVAVAFPHLAPFAGAVAFMVPALLKLVDHLDNHDRILDQRLKLEISEPGMARNLLQPGHYVVFKEEVDEGYYINQDLRVLLDEQGAEFTKCSYAVFDISRQFLVSHEWQIDQKIAKLIAELNGKGQSGKVALEFLRETLDGYSNFEKIKRGRDLQSKQNLTEPEKVLLNKLLEDDELSPFLESHQ